MRILHIISDITLRSGGPVTTLRNITSIWLAAGFDVTVLTIHRSGTLAKFSAKVTSFPSSFPERLANSNAAIAWLSDAHQQYDIVFIHGIWTALTIRAANLLRKRGQTYVVIPHGSLDAFDLQKKALAKRILGPALIRRCLEGSAAVLCSSEREVESLVTYGAKCRAISLPWPVPTIHSTVRRMEARKALGLRDEEFVILSLGRIDYKKGFPVLLPAFKRLVTKHPNARLLIVGPDSNGYTKIVRGMVDQHDLNNSVTFLPAVAGDEKLRLQNAADCFALPSLNENFGNTVMEAMQQGLPCVISNNVYICDAVEQGGAGIVCQYDEVAVFNALESLVTDTALRARMAEAAKLVAKSFAPEVLKERYLAMIDGVVSRTPSTLVA